MRLGTSIVIGRSNASDRFWLGSLKAAQAPIDGRYFSSDVINDIVASDVGVVAIRHNALLDSPPTKGPWDWSGYDAQWRAMQAAGLKLYLTFFDGAPGAAAYPGDDADPGRAATERVEWAAQAADGVGYLEANYPGLLVAVEVWNEPDGSWPVPAADYVPLIAAVRGAIRANPAFDHIPICGPATVLSPGAYWQVLVDEGIADEIDWVSHHIYSPPHVIEDRLAALRTKLEQIGARKLPIMISEYGGEGASSAYEIASNLTALRASGVRGGSYFTLRNYPTFPHAGLLETDGSLARHGRVWRTWHRIVGENAAYLGRASDLPFTIQCHHFRVVNQDVRVVWASAGTPAIDISGHYIAMNHEGAPIEAALSQTLVEEPIYLIGDVAVELAPGQDVLVAGNQEQFSLVQGQDGWTYQWLLDGMYTHAEADRTSGTWIRPGSRFWSIGPNNMHPASISGKTIYAVRKWNVPDGVGRIRLMGTWSRSSEKGDGSELAILHNSVFKSREMVLSGEISFEHTFNVVKGDVVEFRAGTGPSAETSYDNTSLNAFVYSTGRHPDEPDLQ